MKVTRENRNTFRVLAVLVICYGAVLSIYWKGFVLAWHTLPIFLVGSSFLPVVITLPILLGLFPMLQKWQAQQVERRKQLRARWRQRYSKSPEANLLNLHD